MLERALNRIMLVVIASRFPETEKPLPLKTEKCHNIGCLYSISGFLMALTAALKAQIAAWYKALQEQIPDFIPRAPQRQMIADVAKTLAGEEGRHLAIEAPTGVGKTLSYLIPGIAIAREEQKTLVVSTANVALQDQIYSKDLPLLKKIIPDLKFTAAFGRGRYVCPRNLTALASTEPTQQDLLAFLDDELTPNNQEEQKRCAKLKGDLDTYKWDGLRDHTDIAIDDDLWRRLSTDKASCLNRNCYYYRECPFFVARREIVIEVLRIVIGGLRLFHRCGGLSDFFIAIPGKHQVILRLCHRNTRFRLHQGNLIRLVIQFAQHLARFDSITFVHRQRFNAPPNTETKIYRTNIHVAIQRQAVILAALIPPVASGNHGGKYHYRQSDHDRFFHHYKLLCDNPCKIRSI